MKFALAVYKYSSRPDDHGICREWYCRGTGDAAKWTPVFDCARQMELTEALAVYTVVDSPQRKLGLVPVE